MPGSINRWLVAFVCLSFCFLITVLSQNPETQADATSAGVALYERGDTEGAIKQLSTVVKKSRDDARAWHYLGLAQLKAGNLKAAREALGNASSLRTGNISAQLFQGPNREWRDEQVTSFTSLINDLIESQTRTLETISDQQELEKDRIALQRSQDLADCVQQSTKVIDGHNQLRLADMKIVKARIYYKPEPRYPSSTLLGGPSGMVVLRAAFMVDGSVRYIELLKSPDRALAEESIRVAKLIRFTPQMFCGKPVNSFYQLEYDFMH